jgi:hypothetical protein
MALHPRGWGKVEIAFGFPSSRSERLFQNLFPVAWRKLFPARSSGSGGDWPVELSGQHYEHACHEANYGLANTLRGARVAEAEAAAKEAAP